jgi:release factor glutamine methyltransferase
VARENAERLGLSERVELTPVLPPEGRRFDLVVANLPYVGEAELEGLEPEVGKWEPREALLGGPDGLDVLRATIPAAAALAPVMALEIGEGQAGAVAAMLVESGFADVKSRRDLAGIERIVWGPR